MYGPEETDILHTWLRRGLFPFECIWKGCVLLSMIFNNAEHQKAPKDSLKKKKHSLKNRSDLETKRRLCVRMWPKKRNGLSSRGESNHHQSRRNTTSFAEIFIVHIQNISSTHFLDKSNLISRKLPFYQNSSVCFCVCVFWCIRNQQWMKRYSDVFMNQKYPSLWDSFGSKQGTWGEGPVWVAVFILSLIEVPFYFFLLIFRLLKNPVKCLVILVGSLSSNISQFHCLSVSNKGSFLL